MGTACDYIEVRRLIRGIIVKFDFVWIRRRIRRGREIVAGADKQVSVHGHKGNLTCPSGRRSVTAEEGPAVLLLPPPAAAEMVVQAQHEQAGR